MSAEREEALKTFLEKCGYDLVFKQKNTYPSEES
jgi:hypothetical protein